MVVVDDLGGVVEGATVTGDFTGTINELGILGTTGANGTTVIETVGLSEGQCLGDLLCNQHHAPDV